MTDAEEDGWTTGNSLSSTGSKSEDDESEEGHRKKKSTSTSSASSSTSNRTPAGGSSALGSGGYSHHHGSEIADAEGRLRTSRAECEQLRMKVKATRDECIKLQNQVMELQEVKEICRRLDTEVSFLRSKTQSHTDEMTERLMQLEEENKTMRQHVSNLENQIFDLQSPDTIGTRVVTLERENELLCRESTDVREEYRRFVDDVGGQVVKSIIAQKSLRDEYLHMRNRLQSVERQNQYLTELLHNRIRPTTTAPACQDCRAERQQSPKSSARSPANACVPCQPLVVDAASVPVSWSYAGVEEQSDDEAPGPSTSAGVAAITNAVNNGCYYKLEFSQGVSSPCRDLLNICETLPEQVVEHEASVLAHVPKSSSSCSVSSATATNTSAGASGRPARSSPASTGTNLTSSTSSGTPTIPALPAETPTRPTPSAPLAMSPSSGQPLARSHVIMGSKTLPLIHQQHRHTSRYHPLHPQNHSQQSQLAAGSRRVCPPPSRSFSKDDGYSSMTCDLTSPISSRRELSTVGECPPQLEDDSTATTTTSENTSNTIVCATAANPATSTGGSVPCDPNSTKDNGVEGSSTVASTIGPDVFELDTIGEPDPCSLSSRRLAPSLDLETYALLRRTTVAAKRMAELCERNNRLSLRRSVSDTALLVFVERINFFDTANTASSSTSSSSGDRDSRTSSGSGRARVSFLARLHRKPRRKETKDLVNEGGLRPFSEVSLNLSYVEGLERRLSADTRPSSMTTEDRSIDRRVTDGIPHECLAMEAGDSSRTAHALPTLASCREPSPQVVSASRPVLHINSGPRAPSADPPKPSTPAAAPPPVLIQRRRFGGARASSSSSSRAAGLGPSGPGRDGKRQASTSSSDDSECSTDGARSGGAVQPFISVVAPSSRRRGLARGRHGRRNGSGKRSANAPAALSSSTPCSSQQTPTRRCVGASTTPSSPAGSSCGSKTSAGSGGPPPIPPRTCSSATAAAAKSPRVNLVHQTSLDEVKKRQPRVRHLSCSPTAGQTNNNNNNNNNGGRKVAKGSSSTSSSSASSSTPGRRSASGSSSSSSSSYPNPMKMVPGRTKKQPMVEESRCEPAEEEEEEGLNPVVDLLSPSDFRLAPEGGEPGSEMVGSGGTMGELTQLVGGVGAAGDSLFHEQFLRLCQRSAEEAEDRQIREKIGQLSQTVSELQRHLIQLGCHGQILTAPGHQANPAVMLSDAGAGPSQAPVAASALPPPVAHLLATPPVERRGNRSRSSSASCDGTAASDRDDLYIDDDLSEQQEIILGRSAYDAEERDSLLLELEEYQLPESSVPQD